MTLTEAQPATAFTPTHHALALVVFGVVVALLVLCGRRHDRPTRLAFAAVGLGVWLLSAVFYVLPANLEPDKSLPIQACDLLALLAPMVLATQPLLRTLVYFGGFGLTTQAFITPTSDIGGPDHIKFWIFWLLHGSILATAIYIVVVDRYRPTLKDLGVAAAWWGGYALAMIGLNYGTSLAGLNDGDGWYYGYLGPSLPEIVQGSVLKYLGPWPVRPLMMLLLGFGVFVLCWLPWAVVKRRADMTK